MANANVQGPKSIVIGVGSDATVAACVVAASYKLCCKPTLRVSLVLNG